jgi:hypothetical protein
MKYLIYLLPTIIVCTLAWLAGFNFERGLFLFWVGIFSILGTIALYGVRNEF